MPVLLKSSYTVDDNDFEDFKIIRDKTAAEVEAVVQDFITGFNDEYGGELEVIGGWNIHEDDINDAFTVINIREEDAAVLQSLLGSRFGEGLIGYLDL